MRIKSQLSSFLAFVLLMQPLLSSAQEVSFFAALPTKWVDQANACAPPGGIFDVDVTLGSPDPVTVAGLQTAVNRWDGTTWYRIKVPGGALLHSSTYVTAPDGTATLLNLPERSGVSKCLVLESTTPLLRGVTACAGGTGIPGYLGAARNPGCANGTDLSKMWTFQIDSTPLNGNKGIYGSPFTNHIVLRDINLTVAPGSSQSSGGSKVAILAELDGDTEGLENYYFHGWDPGDPGQPAGACVGWNKHGLATTNGTAVTWVSSGTSPETSNRFGPDFSDGTHSPGFPQATIKINGVNYTIASHDPAASDQALTLSTSAGVQTAVAYTLTNPATALPSSGGGTVSYANGCGDDNRGIQLNGTNLWLAFGYAEKIHWANSESHVISSGFSAGPIKIDHNYLEGGSAVIFSGGAAVDARSFGTGPVHNYEIRSNYIGHDFNWRFLTGGAGASPHPPFGCGPLDSLGKSNTCPMNWALKNNIELKLGVQVLIAGNMFGPVWADGQSGYSHLQDPSTCSGGQTCGVINTIPGDPRNGYLWTETSNVRFENNWVQHVAQFIEHETTPHSDSGMGMHLDYLDYINNVIGPDIDAGQMGSPGPDLFQWGGANAANRFLCVMSRSTVAGVVISHAACSPPLMSNQSGNALPVVDSVLVLKSMTRTSNKVTVASTSVRIDPQVGGTVKVTGSTGGLFDGTFSISGVTNSGVSTPCTTGNGTGPQPCIRADGTFGDSFSYTDNRADANECTTPTSCKADAVNVVYQTLADKMTNMNPGDLVRILGCSGGSTPTSYQVGAGAPAVQAVAPTAPLGLDVYYAQPGATPNPDNSGTVCEFDNNAGFPTHSTFRRNTVLAQRVMGINANNTFKQHFMNQFVHNTFLMPAGNNAIVTCGNIGGQGTPVFGCWDLNTFLFYDNVMLDPTGTRAAQWSVVPGGSTPNSFPTNTVCPGATATASCLGFTGFMSGAADPTVPCAFSGNPLNCPQMTLPFLNNFQLSMLKPVASSSYALELADTVVIEAAFVSNIYVCPVGANCGAHGPYPDFGTAPSVPASHVMKGNMTSKGSLIQK